MESAPVTTAPFQFKWQGIAQHVYDEYLSKPYTSPTIPNDWEYTHGDVTIPRPNHSLTHTLRTAAYVSEVVKAYNCFHKPPLTSKDIDQIQIALLFYVVGRENEASFGNPEYLRYRQKSADAFEKYVRKYLSAQFTEAELQFYKTGIYNAYSSAPAEYIIIRICHDLDLIRCYTRDKYNEKLKEAAVHIGPHATPLAELAEECLQRSGGASSNRATGSGGFSASNSLMIRGLFKRMTFPANSRRSTGNSGYLFRKC